MERARTAAALTAATAACLFSSNSRNSNVSSGKASVSMQPFPHQIRFSTQSAISSSGTSSYDENGT